MFAPKNIGGQFETRRRASDFANYLITLLAFLVLGVPITPSAIRTTLAGWALVTATALQFVLSRRRPSQVGMDGFIGFGFGVENHDPLEFMARSK